MVIWYVIFAVLLMLGDLVFCVVNMKLVVIGGGIGKC